MQQNTREVRTARRVQPTFVNVSRRGVKRDRNAVSRMCKRVNNKRDRAGAIAAELLAESGLDLPENRPNRGVKIQDWYVLFQDSIFASDNRGGAFRVALGHLWDALLDGEIGADDLDRLPNEISTAIKAIPADYQAECLAKWSEWVFISTNPNQHLHTMDRLDEYYSGDLAAQVADEVYRLWGWGDWVEWDDFYHD